MGSLWEPFGKGVPFLGAPGNSLDSKPVIFSALWIIEEKASENGTENHDCTGCMFFG